MSREGMEARQRIFLDGLKELATTVAEKLGRPAVLMEVCGTHTTAIARSGVKSLLSPLVDLRSGPGCPVCVTDQSDVDRMVALSQWPEVVIATFGDMLKVPGTVSSLELERAKGAAVEIFYSPMDALNYAGNNPGKQVVFLGIGFETTTPAIAVTILEAKKRHVDNYSVFVSHKIVPPAMRALLDDPSLRVDGFILPGHVSAILGRKAFDFIADEYCLPSVIAGFETSDVLGAIYLLLQQISRSESVTMNGYRRLVTEEGNDKAREIVQECFRIDDALWRGFGMIPASGLALREDYRTYDALHRFAVTPPESKTPDGCSCGDILKGRLEPSECPLFGSACTPFDPVGPCMVSSEGACAVCYQYD
jgi:hydrogenase expression/formation protein HypD